MLDTFLAKVKESEGKGRTIENIFGQSYLLNNKPLYFLNKVTSNFSS